MEYEAYRIELRKIADEHNQLSIKRQQLKNTRLNYLKEYEVGDKVLIEYHSSKIKVSIVCYYLNTSGKKICYDGRGLGKNSVLFYKIKIIKKLEE